MKKMLMRVLAMTLVLMTVFALCSAAFAATVKSVSQTSDADGDCKKTFYVKTSTTKTLKMTMTEGQLCVKVGGSIDSVFGETVPDSYEITIWYWNSSTKKWVQEQNYDVYCKTSATIKLKKSNTYYKILVDSYGAKTTVKSYVNHGKITWITSVMGHFDTEFNCNTYYWKKLPKWTIKNAVLSYCTLYTHNPVN